MEPRRLFRLLLPVSRGPDSSWDSRRAFHKSPPNELDRGSSIRGSGLPLMRHDVRHVVPSGGSPFGDVSWLWSSLALAMYAVPRREVIHKKQFIASVATPSLFLACSIRIPRNDTVRHTEITIRSTVNALPASRWWRHSDPTTSI